MKPDPIIIDGEFKVLKEGSNPSLAAYFEDDPSITTITASNAQTGDVEIITKEMARRKPLSHFSEINTNHTDAIRGGRG